MNSEMKTKLEKYMQADGTYNIAEIRSDFPGDNRAVFNALWSDDGESANSDQHSGFEFMSPEWRAALEYNEAVIEAQKTEQDSNPVQVAASIELAIMTPTIFSEREAKAQLKSVVAESAKVELVKMFLARIDGYNPDTLTKDQSDMAERRYNRALWSLEHMDLAAVRDNGGFQDAWWDLSLARQFIQPPVAVQLFNSDAPEENLTR